MMEIETKRLWLRHPLPQDRDGIFSIMSDRSTCLDDGGYEPYQRQDTAFLRTFQGILDSREERLFAIAKSDGQVISMLHIQLQAADAVELGYCTSIAHRRLGYTEEALRGLLPRLAKKGIRTVYASAYTYNEASLRLLEKLGFRCTRRKVQAERHAERGLVDLAYFEKKLDHSGIKLSYWYIDKATKAM